RARYLACNGWRHSRASKPKSKLSAFNTAPSSINGRILLILWALWIGQGPRRTAKPLSRNKFRLESSGRPSQILPQQIGRELVEFGLQRQELPILFRALAIRTCSNRTGS